MASFPSEENQLANYPTRHNHNISLRGGLRRYTCSGCKEYGTNTGYKCSSCPKFILHKDCAELPDEYRDHPFYTEPFKFRKQTRLPHDCSACGEPLEGFLFSSPSHDVRLHPLCMVLPRSLNYGGHNHSLQLLMTEGKYNCSRCDEDKKHWSYRCEEITCKLRVDLSCVKVNLHGVCEHGILRIAPRNRRKECMGALGNASVICFRSSVRLACRVLRCCLF